MDFSSKRSTKPDEDTRLVQQGDRILFDALLEEAGSAAHEINKFGILSARKNRTASVASETKEEGEKFGPLEATDWRLIFAGGKEISFKKGDILIGDNQKPRDVYLVVEGEVHIKAKTIEGPKMITKVKKNC